MARKDSHLANGCQVLVRFVLFLEFFGSELADDDGEMICFIAPRRGYIQISSLMPNKFKLIKVSLVEEEW